QPVQAEHDRDRRADVGDDRGGTRRLDQPAFGRGIGLGDGRVDERHRREQAADPHQGTEDMKREEELVEGHGRTHDSSPASEYDAGLMASRSYLYSLLVAAAACAPHPRNPYATTNGALQLSKVVLYRNGVGYFERGGKVAGDAFTLRVRKDQ